MRLPAEAAHAMRSTAANVRTGRRSYDGRRPKIELRQRPPVTVRRYVSSLSRPHLLSAVCALTYVR
jgi:hypothetical protein